MVLGTYDYIESEGRDRVSTDLPDDQKLLLKNIYKINKNIVLVLINGSTISLPWASKNIPAIIEAWYPGQSGGKAIAEVLFGDFNPGGKLPLTFYTGLSQLPPFDDYDIRNGRTYMYLKDKPLYPFGYGLSYTKFNFSEILFDSITHVVQDTIEVKFKLTNIGDREGSEVPQLYIENNSVKRLKAFKRIFLKKNDFVQTSLKVAVSDLELWDEKEEKYNVAKGEYKVYLGTSSDQHISSKKIVIK